MSYPLWPAYALDPPPLNESYKITLADTVIRTDFEQGLARQRRAFSNGPTTFTLTWAMTPQEFQLYLDWRQWALSGGEGWFNLDVFSGDDYHEFTVRFVKGPTEPVRQGGEWLVTAVIETFHPIYRTMTDTAAAMLTWPGTVSLDTVVGDFHDAVTALAADYASLFP